MTRWTSGRQVANSSSCLSCPRRHQFPDCSGNNVHLVTIFPLHTPVRDISWPPHTHLPVPSIAMTSSLPTRTSSGSVRTSSEPPTLQRVSPLILSIPTINSPYVNICPPRLSVGYRDPHCLLRRPRCFPPFYRCVPLPSSSYTINVNLTSASHRLSR